MTPLAFFQRALLTLAFFGLTGCASVYRVDNQVESFTRWADGANSTATAAPAPPQRYQFEQLPSQTSGQAGQTQDVLERWTREALAPLGWTLAEPRQTAEWSVQVTAQSIRLPRAPWEDPWDSDRFRWFGHTQFGVGSGGVMWSPWLIRDEYPYFQRQVSLVIRAKDSGRVVYETRAAHDGRWNGAPALWKAMLSAALTGFPASPTGIRQVNIDVPR